jgi:hypothetical protein
MRFLEFLENKKMLKIIIFFIELILFYFVVEKSFGKYYYVESFEALNLYRNLELPIADISYSTTEITNEDVTLILKLNKDIDVPEGFEWDKENKILTKNIKENENGIIKIKDLSGNENSFEYKINWIDKENPKIVGVEDGNSYNSPLNLEFTDNVGIKDVDVEYLGYLSAVSNRTGYAGEKYNLLDISDTTYIARILNTPKDAVKYRYYLGNTLKAETTELTYTFKNLEKNQYEINYTIEALNSDGKVIDTTTGRGKTSTYKNISITRNSTGATIKLSGIDSKIKSVLCYFWPESNSSLNKYKIANVENSTATISFNISEYNNIKGIYVMHLYTRDSNENLSNVVGYNIEIGSGYMYAKTGTDFSKITVNPNKLTEKGRYRIKVIDVANNFIEYFIRVK